MFEEDWLGGSFTLDSDSFTLDSDSFTLDSDKLDGMCFSMMKCNIYVVLVEVM